LRILVLGAGGIGGYVGAWLVKAGADVSFLVRPARAEKLRREGLRLESKYGNASLEVRALTAEEMHPEHDLAVLTCKSYDLNEAVEAVAPGLAPSGAVLPLLNGLSHIDTLNARFGRERVLGGSTRIASMMKPDGTVHQLFDNREVIFGEQDGAMSERVLTIRDIGNRAPGLEMLAVPDVMQQMWNKLCFLGTGGSMYTLMRANLGEINRGSAEGRRLFQQLFATAVDVARANGYPPDQAFIDRTAQMFTRTDSTLASSLARDVEDGNRTEGEHIIGFLLRGAQAAGLDDTILACAYANLKAYEQRREAGRLPGRGGMP
jgi:2-dehydropantoate 2-reductase